MSLRGICTEFRLAGESVTKENAVTVSARFAVLVLFAAREREHLQLHCSAGDSAGGSRGGGMQK